MILYVLTDDEDSSLLLVYDTELDRVAVDSGPLLRRGQKFEIVEVDQDTLDALELTADLEGFRLATYLGIMQIKDRP